MKRFLVILSGGGVAEILAENFSKPQGGAPFNEFYIFTVTNIPVRYVLATQVVQIIITKP